MKFKWDQATAPLDGELLYRQGEYSFDFKVASSALLAERVGSAGNTSLSFTTLQTEVSIERGELLYPWGLFPNTRWQAGRLALPTLQPGRVRVVIEGEALQPGVSVSFSDSASWPVVWDQATGWVCFGNPSSSRDVAAVEYAKNSAVVIAEGQLISIWLRPKMVS